MINTTIFGICFFVYALALGFAVYNLVNKKKWVENTSFWLFFAAFVLHTLALLVRWGEAGDVEVAAFQEAEGRILQGMEWFNVWISHPPWSNLYESLVCFGWGVTLVSVYAIRKFKIPVLPIFAIGLSLLTMGAASLLINQDISPLVPALQSKWIHLHVSFATICYPAFGLAAILSIFYLLKVNVRMEIFGAFLAIANALIILSVGRGGLFFKGEYGMNLISRHGDDIFRLTYAAQDASGAVLSKSDPVNLAIPYAGFFLLVAFAGLLVASVLYILPLVNNKLNLKKIADGLMALGLLGIIGTVIGIIASQVVNIADGLDTKTIEAIIYSNHMGASGSLVDSYQLHGQGPFILSISGNPFEFMMLVTAALQGLFYFAIAWRRDWLVDQLPSPDRLDELSYKTIMFAFPFLTLLIVTGAVWAYYAWGRYWGWDPKETWSLITWIVYSIYLHVRLTHGWEGKWPAVIAVLGFVVVIFTYLGVNLVISGLHSYAGA